jgi:hypothetical protein
MPAKKHKKATHHKRRRVGAKGGQVMHDIMHVVGQVLSAGIGGAVAVFGVNAVKTALSAQIAAGKFPMWVPPAGAIATGAAIMHFGKKMPYVPEFGLGMSVVGSVMTANEAGINMPGIAGLAMANNAPPGTATFSKAVGTRSMGCEKMGAGPSSYLNQTVGRRKSMRTRVGALVSD